MLISPKKLWKKILFLGRFFNIIFCLGSIVTAFCKKKIKLHFSLIVNKQLTEKQKLKHYCLADEGNDF